MNFIPLFILGSLAWTSAALLIPPSVILEQKSLPETWDTGAVTKPSDFSSLDTHGSQQLYQRETYDQIYVHCQVRERFAPSWGPAAKLCIEELANRKHDECRATKEETVLCRNSNTVITSQTVGKSEDTVTSCGNVAISAGRIMDLCYQQDETVVGFAIAMGTYTFRVDIRPA